MEITHISLRAPFFSTATLAQDDDVAQPSYPYRSGPKVEFKVEETECLAKEIRQSLRRVIPEMRQSDEDQTIQAEDQDPEAKLKLQETLHVASAEA